MREIIEEMNRFRKEITDEVMAGYTGKKRGIFKKMLDNTIDDLIQVIHFKTVMVAAGDIGEETISKAYEHISRFYSEKFKNMDKTELIFAAMSLAFEEMMRKDDWNEQEYQGEKTKER